MQNVKQPVRVLIVEDSPTQAQELRIILEDQGFAVDVATDGQKGLDKIRSDPYDLVFSDIQMPGLTGYELCQHIKADPSRKGIPVILLTALSSPSDILQGLECGADNFITKPYDPVYLIGRVQQILANKTLRSTRKFKVGVELSIGGKSVSINSDREQILDVLISTFDEFVRTREREHANQVAAEAARQSERFLQSTLDALGAHICILDQSGAIVAANASWRRFTQTHGWFGTSGNIGTDYLVACHSASGQEAGTARALAAGIQQVMANQRATFYGVVPYATRESLCWFSVRVTRLENSRPARVVVSHTDDTELKSAEKQTREQALLLDKATDAILVRDLHDRILYWNHSAEQLYQWTKSEVLGQMSDELLFKEALPELAKIRATVLSKGEWSGELRQVTRAGEQLIVQSRWTLIRDEEGNPKSILVMNSNITEKKKIEAQYYRAQRMESLGTLAGGIAHDLNNMLTPIMMAVQILRGKFLDADSQRLLATLEASAKRGADLVQQVLTFASGREGERGPLALKHVVKETQKMLQHSLPKGIQVETAVASDLWTILADSTQVSQVLMNLCVNARDAMPQHGTLSITAKNRVLDEHSARVCPEAKPGRYVELAVADTGTGIPAEILDKIFDPFFTTKEQGQGTGLGLSTSLGIVKSHGGFVNVYSEIGKGTKFTIHLPAAEAMAARQLSEPRAELPQGNGELILLVDDEAAIREITKLTLEGHGFRVLTAENGAEAVALFAQRSREVALVLTDMAMPLMDGAATIQALRKMSPDVPIVAASGLSASGKIAQAKTEVQAVLNKPYTAETLLNTLHAILHDKDHPSPPHSDRLVAEREN